MHKPFLSLKSILAEFLPLHRTLASDGQDRALEIIGDYMPEQAAYTVATFPPLAPAWTWRVPERYVVEEAYLEHDGGERIVDFRDNPLHLVSYSLPVDERLTFDALQPHLYFNEKRPNAIPWIFKYYERDWGFCLPKTLFDSLPRDGRYHAVIRSRFVSDPAPGFGIATAVVHPEGGPNPEAGEIMVMAHTCHPAQANDDGSGVVSAIELARRLAEKALPAGSMSVRFWFGPETIGTIVYLANNEPLIPTLRGGIFLEMTGTRSQLAWHHTRQHDHLLDRVAGQVMAGVPHDEREFGAAPANDERVLNGPGVNVPCISINRWPYDEYHTSDDNLDIIDEDMLVGASEAAERVVRIYASNYIPVRNFRGPVFLSGSGLWVDWREDWALNRAVEQIMMRFEGAHSVVDIAQQVGLDYWTVRDYVEKFRAKGFITARPIPSEAAAN
jgi:aminopeptidase-like protein